MLRKISTAFIICFTIMLLLGSALAGAVEITVIPDQASYRANEVACLKVDIVNHTEKEIRNVQIKNLLPPGLSYVSADEAEKTIASIPAGQSATHTIRLRMPAIPKTGDKAMPVLWAAMAIGLLGLFAGLTVQRMRKSKNF